LFLPEDNASNLISFETPISVLNEKRCKMDENQTNIPIIIDNKGVKESVEKELNKAWKFYFSSPYLKLLIFFKSLKRRGGQRSFGSSRGETQCLVGL
jgi:hypothetical protein